MANPFKVDLPWTSVAIKYGLFGWNILLFILGIVLVVTGFGMSLEYATDGGYGEIISGTSGSKYISLSIFIGFIGLAMMIITFFGCYGSIKESTAMTGAYVVLLSITMLALFIGGCVGYAYRDKVDHYVEGMLGDSMKTWCHTSQGPWDYAQKNFQCCGVNGYEDWEKNSTEFKYWSYGYYHFNMADQGRKRRSDDNSTATGKPTAKPITEKPITAKPITEPTIWVPESCCTKDPLSTDTTDPSCGITNDVKNIYTDGCLNTIEKKLKENLVKIAGAAVGISLFTFVVIILAFCLARQYQKKNYDDMN